MRTHLFRAALALVASIGIAAPAFAQGGMIKGTVLDPNGQPVVEAKITMEAVESATRTFTTTSDKKGEFLQIGLRSGAYKVTATKDKVGSQTRTATVRQGGRGTIVDFRLSPISNLSVAEQKKMIALQAALQAGMAAVAANDHDTAITEFDKAIAAMPDCGDCYVNKGFSQIEKKQFPEAEASFRKAVELDKQSADGFAGLASSLNAQKKFEEATTAGEQALKLSGGDAGGGAASPEAAYNQGVILWNGGKFAEAKAQFETAIKGKPDMADAYYQLGMANLNLGQIPDAVTAFEGYLKVAPNGPKAAEVKAAVGALKK